MDSYIQSYSGLISNSQLLDLLFRLASLARKNCQTVLFVVVSIVRSREAIELNEIQANSRRSLQRPTEETQHNEWFLGRSLLYHARETCTGSNRLKNQIDRVEAAAQIHKPDPTVKGAATAVVDIYIHLYEYIRKGLGEFA